MRQRFVTLFFVLALAVGALVLLVEGTAQAPRPATRAGPVPAGLPARVLLGLNNGPDDLGWMTGSHVPWDARYQYLAGGANTGRGWATWKSPAGAFALRYMQASGAHGYLPIFSYYQLLQSSPAAGWSEGDRDYNNLNIRATMKAYYADFRLLMHEARLYGQPVIVHVEPDLWGYMEQRAGGCGRASCVSAAVASSGDADAAAYPNTVQGFAEALLHLRDKYAPNVVMALHASCWGSRTDVCGDPTSTADTAAHAARDAAFLASAGITGNAPGTSSWDLLFTDTSDRDAGFYQYVYSNSHRWWDPTNRTLPNFANFRTWLSGLNAGTRRRIVLWQTPLGNQYFDTDNNTFDHYQDNRAQYFLGDGPRYDHLKEFATAGVVGLLFGRGADGPTDYTDTRGDGITNPAPVQSFQCNRCNTHVSHDSDDDGGYLRIFGGRYLKAGGVAIPVVRSSGARSQVSPAPMPLISRHVPAYASSEYSPATLVDDGSYDTAWRSKGTPAWLAYDLSAVPAAQRRTVLAVWYNASYEYDNAVIVGDDYNSPKDYTIDVNAAPGGGRPPASGWVTLVTVRGNTKHSRQHLVDMAGYNWIRLDATASNGALWNHDIAVNMDIYDAGPGVADDWIFFGDSITAGAMTQNTVGGVPSFAQLIHAAWPARFPAAEDGGMPYLTSGDGARHVPAWLPLFPGTYVGLSYGTNDANGCVPPSAFYNSYVAMVQAVLGAGKVPVIPHIPWARAPNVRRCGPGLNAQIDRLYAAYPRIVHGPDLWTFFQKNQGLISSDNLHPTDQGYGAYRRQWATQMLASVYNQAHST